MSEGFETGIKALNKSLVQILVEVAILAFQPTTTLYNKHNC